jgi:tetratricopeptide (TPR) repeat protein
MKNILVLTFAFLLFGLVQPSHAIPKDAPPKPANKSVQLNDQGAALAAKAQYKEAEELFRQAVAADSKNVTAVFNLAGAYLANKKEDAAIALLTDYTSKYTKDAGLFARLGDAYFGTKNLALSITSYEKALKLDQNYPKLPGKLATAYLLQNRVADAEKMYLTAVNQDPKDGQMLENLSNVFLANHKPDQAISAAKRALQVKPSSGLYVTLGAAYENMKDYKNSLIAYERALDLGSTDPNLKQKIDEVKEQSKKAVS